MNKSKSEPQMSTSAPKDKQKQKSDFMYSVQDDAFIFQTKDLFLQIQFRSPIKQIFEYLEQQQKYSLLSQLTSIGIKFNTEKTLYTKISERISQEYQKYLERTMQYIQNLIMNVHYMKYSRWHYYRQIVRGYRQGLLGKDLDCFGFGDGAGLGEYGMQVLGYLGGVQGDVKRVKEEIKANCKNLQRKIREVNQNMYVKHPFKTQNSRKKQIDSSQLFDSYLRTLIHKTASLQQALDLRMVSSYESINKFAQLTKQISLSGQSIAANLIKQYNQSSELLNRIGKGLQKFGERKEVDLSDHQGDWLKNNRVLPILRNKCERLSFSDRVLCVDQDTCDHYMLQKMPAYEYKDYLYEEENQVLQSRVPANNPYFNFWEHTYDRDRLRKLQLFYQEPSRTSVRYQPKDYNSKIKRKLNKERKFLESNSAVYQTLITEMKGEEEKLWGVPNANDPSRTAYEVVEEAEKKTFQVPKLSIQSITSEDNRLSQQQRKIEAYKEYQEKFQKDRKGEDQSLMVSLRKANGDKLYEQFCIKFGIKDPKRQYSKTKIIRYGLKIQKSLFHNTDLPKLQQFLGNFLREKLFRDSQKYRKRQTMPLILNTKPAAQFCNWRTIKKLGELTQSLKRYIIWASEVIKYEEITAVNREMMGKFTVYAYTDLWHGRSLLFQLKRRLNLKVVGELVERYWGWGELYWEARDGEKDKDEGKQVKASENSLEAIMSKFELTHRLLFGQHTETPNAEASYMKGQQLYNLMIRELTSDSPTAHPQQK